MTFYVDVTPALADGPNAGESGVVLNLSGKQLALVQNMWNELQPNMAYGADAATAIIGGDKVGLVGGGNVPLLKNMNKAVKMYEKQAALGAL